MISNYLQFKKYVQYILPNKIDLLVEDLVVRAKKANLPVLKLLSHLTDKELFDISKEAILDDVINPILDSDPFSSIQKKIEVWKQNHLRVPKEKLEILDVTTIHHLRKSSLIYFLREYGIDKQEQIQIFEEIDDFFNECINLSLLAYEEIQRGELKDKKQLLDGLLANLPVIVTRLDNNGVVTASIGSGIARLGLKENQTVGLNFLSNSEDHAQYIKEAYAGTPVSYIGSWEHNDRTYYYENYFFLENEEKGNLLGFSLDVTERIETNEKLFEAKKLEEQRIALNNLFMQVPALIVVLKGKEGIVELANPTFSKLWGQKQVIGKLMHEAWPELEGHTNLVEKVFVTGETLSQTEYPARIDRNSNGVFEDAYFNFIYQPYYNYNGVIDGVLIFGIDVTQQVNDRIRIQESEERFRTIADEAPAYIFIAGANASLEFINKTWLSFVGMTMEAAKGTGSLSATHPEDIDHVLSTFNDAYEYQKPYTLEVRQKDIQGNYRWILWKGIPRFLPTGEFMGMMGIGIDIHERVTAEQALRLSQERQELAVKAGKIGLWTWNITLDKASYSPEVHDILGLEQGKLVDLENAYNTILQYVFEEDREHLQKEVEVICQKGERDIYVEFRVVNQITKEVIWLSERAEAYYDEGGNPVRMIGSVIDITPTKKIEETLKAKNEELVRINSDLDNFIYTASHDLKAPISNIEGLVAALPEVASEETKNKLEFKEMLDLIYLSINRFKNTIHELADISKVQRNIVDDVTEVDLLEVIEDVKLSLREDIFRSKAILSYNFQDCPPIQFSKRNVRSIIYNLISNSLKYRAPQRDPEIIITISIEGVYLLLIVKDNGLGIQEDKINEMFGMFKRFHNHVEGTGIGLYIVKRILENNGGKIEVESEFGKGTEFKVYFRL